METVAGFDTPEEAALQLELPLLGTLPAPETHEGIIAPAFPTEERERREYHRAADRLLLSPHSRGGSIGILGDVSAAHRALVSACLAASVAAERTAILVDADVRGAHLSFDSNDRAQEGLVDVLRYGVRSPRVVAPTQTPGLNLLPVGAGTVDLEGTFGTEAVGQVFEELAASGDLLLINGPDLRDLHAAARLVSEVDAWILIHELKRSDANKTRALRDTFGREKCVGVLAIECPAPEEAGADAPAGVGEAAAAAATVAVGGAAVAAGALAAGAADPAEDAAADPAEEATDVEAAIADASDEALEITHGSGLPDLDPMAVAASDTPDDSIGDDAPDESASADATTADDDDADGAVDAVDADDAEDVDDLADRLEEPPLAVEEPDAPTSEEEARELERRYAPQAVDRGDGFISAAEPGSEEGPELNVPRPRPSAPSVPMTPSAGEGPVETGAITSNDEPDAIPEVASSDASAAPASAVPAEPRFAAEPPEERSGRGLWLAIGGVTVAALAALVWFQLRSPDESPVASTSGSADRSATATEPPPTSGGTAADGTAIVAEDSDGSAPAASTSGDDAANDGPNGGTEREPGPADARPGDADAAAVGTGTGTGTGDSSDPAGDSPAEVVPSSPPTSPDPVSPPERATPGGRFGVHLVSVKTEADANREAARIGKSGFPTVIREVDLGEKGTWWRVYLGPYGTRDAAARVAQEVKTTGVTDYAMVLRLPRVGAE